ncbi:MAG: hypothetical protein ACRD03_09425 [Acidimicrobiales bacterium]
MLDHVFVEAIAAVRRGLEGALLQRSSVDERLQVDILLGDLSWETSYTLPFEGVPPRVQAELAFDWSAWSQAAYRSWRIGDPGDDPPEIDVEVALRIQRLARPPDVGAVLAALPEEGPAVLGEPLERDSPTVEQHVDPAAGTSPYAVEVSYAGTVALDPDVMEDARRLEEHLGHLGAWIASGLVRLADLDLAFVPPEMEGGGLR